MQKSHCTKKCGASAERGLRTYQCTRNAPTLDLQYKQVLSWAFRQQYRVHVHASEPFGYKQECPKFRSFSRLAERYLSHKIDRYDRRHNAI